MHKPIGILIALLALAGGLVQAADGYPAALGKPGDPAKVDRAIEIGVSDDMRFSPDEVRIKRGQTIRFQVLNGGQLKHMLVLGTLAGLNKQAARLRKFPETQYAGPNAVSIEPGQVGELVWHFTQAGDFDFACLVPGHLAAGMRGKVIVRP
ncbi:MAG: cupredoxin family protein [Betaproteobacteria bacterium]|nr:cupredoxin family protein [Betaproteobacteria bacterium]